jgi:hypothetical protein
VDTCGAILTASARGNNGCRDRTAAGQPVVVHLFGSCNGAQTAGNILDHGYRQLHQAYGGLECFPSIIRCLPDRLLDEEKIELLSRGQI